MGSSLGRSTSCCALRDKHGASEGALGSARSPQFVSQEMDHGLMEQASLLSFAPLYQREAMQPRRLALASPKEVIVFRLSDHDPELEKASPPVLTHRLRVDTSQWQVDSILFCEDDDSKHLAVVLGPPGLDTGGSPEAPPALGAGLARLPFSARGAAHASVVKIWNCTVEPMAVGAPPKELLASQGWSASLQADDARIEKVGADGARIEKVACNRQFFFTLDVAGCCVAWQKNRNFQRRASTELHSAGAVDFIVERMFAYSIGRREKCVSVWSLPDSTALDAQLKLALTIPVEVPLGHLPHLREDVQLARRPNSARDVLAVQVTLLRRPLSRWSGCQGSSRGPQFPRGCLFGAATLLETCDVAGAGSGLLLEWSLRERPSLMGAQVAHDSPIVSLSYGPYDNGPVITGDARGVFRVWDFTLNYRFCLVQQLELPCQASRPSPALVVEPPRCLYVVLDGRLHVWQRAQEGVVTLTARSRENGTEIADRGRGAK